ncbi:GAS1 protein, partial [Atractosteus spatula]|nr:GAS1 protein [Atractosteus spatula]
MKTWCSALALFGWILVALDAQFVCWQALLRCQQEKDCELAYNQYLAACEANIKGNRRQCPSHCINALIRLNQTRNGPDLETCECGQDAQCRRAKRAIEPCLPRRYPGDAAGIGCTEARQRCEDEPGCQSTLTAYLSNCGQLFNGRKCTVKCKSTIQQMLCVCDGVERPFCEVVKENMGKLCSVGDHGVSTSYGDTDDLYEDEDYELKVDREETDSESAGSFSRCSRSSPLLPLQLSLLLALRSAGMC